MPYYLHFFSCWKGSTPFYRAHFGQGSGPILIGSAHCTGEESSLIECAKSMNGLFTCSHTEDAGVQCQGTLNGRLKSGNVHSEQTYETITIFNGIMLTLNIYIYFSM